MVLVNALYLKAQWLEPFKEKNTKPMDFTRADGKKVSVAAIFRQANFAYFDHSAFEAVEINLDSPDLMFLAIKPKQDITSLYRVPKEISLKELFGEAKYPKVRLRLPKFKVNSDLDLSKSLDQLGMG